MDVTDIFAKRLKGLREGEGLSQNELAKRLGISRGSVSFYENGDRTADIETLKKVADYFDVGYDYMLGKSNIKKENDLNIANMLMLSDETVNNISTMKENLNVILGETISSLASPENADILIYMFFLKNMNFIHLHPEDVSLTDYATLEIKCKESFGLIEIIENSGENKEETLRNIFSYMIMGWIGKVVDDITLQDEYNDYKKEVEKSNGNSPKTW